MPRHRAAREVKNGRGIGPVIADQLDWIAVGGIERPAADQWPARPAAALLAMAGRASPLGVDGCALRVTFAAGQIVGMNRDKQRRRLIVGDLHAVIERYDIMRGEAARA